LAGEIAVRVLRAARPQARLRLSAIDRPFGEAPSGKSVRLEEKRSRGQPVLDGLAETRMRGRTLAISKASNAASFENGIRSNNAMIL
jgi:hypothetical protein